MQNFLLGQAELDKRKQDLAEQLRQEEEKRREQARIEAEKQEKIRSVVSLLISFRVIFSPEVIIPLLIRQSLMWRPFSQISFLISFIAPFTLT